MWIMMLAMEAEDSIFVRFVITPELKNRQPENLCDRNFANSTQVKCEYLPNKLNFKIFMYRLPAPQETYHSYPTLICCLTAK